MSQVTRIDASVLYRRLKFMGVASKAARRRAAMEIGARLVHTMAIKAPRDTNRYVRAWIQAGNRAGLTSMVVPAVARSGNYDKFVDRLVEQVRYWDQRKEALAQTYNKLYGYREFTGPNSRRRVPGMTKGQREVKAKVDKAFKNHARALQELERLMAHADTVLLIGMKTAVDKGQVGGRTLTRTTRTKVYGGEGRVTDTPYDTFVFLHNQEPHARIVERNTRILERSLVEAKALGVKIVGKTMLTAIKSAATR